MLKVKGSSMIDAGIYDGDKIIVKKQNSANNGDIVVAFFNDSATVKRFFKKDNKIISSISIIPAPHIPRTNAWP